MKVNVALSELPDFAADPGTDRSAHYTGAIELCHSLDYLERAFQDARAGRAAGPAVRATACIPSTLDRTLCPEGTHVMSTVHPVGAARLVRRAAPGRAGGVRRPGDRRLHELAPGFARSVIHRQVIGPYEMEHDVRPDRRQHLPR